MANNNIECVIFDWDGTLADSTGDIVTCMQAAIEANELPERSVESILNIIGLGLDEAAASLYPDVPEDKQEALIGSYRHHYKSNFKGKTTLFPYVREVLEELRERKYLLAIATGKSRLGLENSMHDTGISHLFHSTRCVDEALSKPHPRMLHDIFYKLDVIPGNAIMVGDSVYDMEMALSAGCLHAAVTYGAQDHHRLLEYNPVISLQSISELLPWLINQT